MESDKDSLKLFQRRNSLSGILALPGRWQHSTAVALGCQNEEQGSACAERRFEDGR